jgi:hypothetical protein
MHLKNLITLVEVAIAVIRRWWRFPLVLGTRQAAAFSVPQEEGINDLKDRRWMALDALD